MTTAYLGPEHETATGPNFQQSYLVSATVAPGQTVTGFDLTDQLPSGMQFVSLGASSANGSTAASTTSTPSTTAPGGTLTRHFDKVVGTGGASDASMVFSFYVPRDDASTSPVLNLTTGAFVALTDQASAQGSWTPLNPLQPTTSVTSNLATDVVTAKSVAVQKGVTDLTRPGASQPGDVLQYTINFQVSDFFALANPCSRPTSFPTASTYDGSRSHPTLTVASARRRPLRPSAGFGAGDGLRSACAGYDRTGRRRSGLTCRASWPRGASAMAQLLGGSIPSRGGPEGPDPIGDRRASGGRPARSSSATVIQQKFDYNYPSGEAFVDQGDVLTNGVSASADVLSYADLSADGSSRVRHQRHEP